MLLLTEKLEQTLSDNGENHITGEVIMTIEQRIKSRLKLTLTDGREVGLILNRGLTLRGGDLLSDAKRQQLIKVIAADEAVSTITAGTSLLLARLCYHLGNRHVPLQIGDGFARYQRDHVLDEMVLGLGGKIDAEIAPFEPEAGAYGGHSHSHSHHGSELPHINLSRNTLTQSVVKTK